MRILVLQPYLQHVRMISSPLTLSNSSAHILGVDGGGRMTAVTGTDKSSTGTKTRETRRPTQKRLTLGSVVAATSVYPGFRARPGSRSHAFCRNGRRHCWRRLVRDNARHLRQRTMDPPPPLPFKRRRRQMTAAAAQRHVRWRRHGQ